jgi:hypothetical protein
MKVNPIDLAHAALRCGAKTRRGMPCMAPAIHGKKRCRMHGGNSPGPPKGSQNALKHGRYTTAAIMGRRQMREVFRRIRALIGTIE